MEPFSVHFFIVILLLGILVRQEKRTDILYQSYLTKLASLQCFDTMEQNRTLWNTDPQFKSSFRYLYSVEYFLIDFLTLF